MTSSSGFVPMVPASPVSGEARPASPDEMGDLAFDTPADFAAWAERRRDEWSVQRRATFEARVRPILTDEEASAGRPR